MTNTTLRPLTLAAGAAVLSALAGCYTTGAPLYDTGMAMNIVGTVACQSGSGTPTLWDVTKVAGKNAYHAVPRTEGAPFDMVFVPSTRPFIAVLQATSEGKTYYSSANLVSSQITYVDEVKGRVAAIARRHGVTLTKDNYLQAMSGTEADEKAFLAAVGDRGTSSLFACKRQ